ncbi:MAG: DUF2306 domain-containing protein [Planctomycetaceae bacterium]|nr:DUF2306 domain-containing protein [Planctomycetaceae bacterium]
MPLPRATTLQRVLTFTACVLMGKVLVEILLNYRHYWPPNFDADFLLGRERYFWNGYHWAFYAHIAIGPCALIQGTLLVSTQFRRRFPRSHRALGRIQAVSVLLILVPSGLWMAWYAASGAAAGVGFAFLALATGMSTALGWRAAVRRRFDIHRRWMWRCHLLLCSTIILRLTAGLGTLLGLNAEWFDVQTAWTSWLVPLLLFEGLEWTRRRTVNCTVSRIASPQYSPTVSPPVAE